MLYQNIKSIIENDVILVFVEDKPTFFARVEKIIADVKPGWWQVTFLVLQVPLVTVTWILDNEQIRGSDFTMQGTPIRIEKVIAPNQEETPEPAVKEPAPQKSKKANILTLTPK